MSTIPPWLVPPNFLGAMQSGASLGLDQRRTDLASWQAMQNAIQDQRRTALAEWQAARNQELAQQQLQTQVEQNAAANALRAVQNEALALYRRDQLANQAALQKMRESAAQQKQAEAAKMLQAREKYASLLGQGVPAQEALYRVPELVTPSAVAQLNRAAAVKAIPEPIPRTIGNTAALQIGDKLYQEHSRPEPKLSQLDNELLKARMVELKKLREELVKRESAGWSLKHPFTAPSTRVNEVSNKIVAIESELQSRYGQKATTPTGFTSPMDVKAAFEAGRLSQQDALNILRNDFGYE